LISLRESVKISCVIYRERLQERVRAHNLSSVKVGENHVVLGYRRERPIY
jgi:hypothetical protein